MRPQLRQVGLFSNLQKPDPKFFVFQPHSSAVSGLLAGRHLQSLKCTLTILQHLYSLVLSADGTLGTFGAAPFTDWQTSISLILVYCRLLNVKLAASNTYLSPKGSRMNTSRVS